MRPEQLCDILQDIFNTIRFAELFSVQLHLLPAKTANFVGSQIAQKSDEAIEQSGGKIINV